MKKLMSILCTITLGISASTSIIACKPKSTQQDSDQSEDGPIADSYEEVLSKYKFEVNDIIASHVEEVSKKWFQSASSSESNQEHEFLNSNSLESAIKGLQNNNNQYKLKTVFEKTDGPQNKTKYFNDIQSLLNFSDLKKKVIDLTKKSEYDILFKSLNEDSLININREFFENDPEEAFVQYYKGNFNSSNNDVQQREGNESFFAYANSWLKINLNCNSKDGTLTTFEYSNPINFKYSITDNTALYEFIQSKKSKLKFDFLQDKSSLIDGNNDFTNDYESMIKKFNENSNSIKGNIQNKLTENLENYGVKINTTNYEIETNWSNIKDFWDHSFNANTESKMAWKEKKVNWTNKEDENIYKSNQNLYDYIFKTKYNENAKQEENEYLKSYLSENWNEWYKNYLNSIIDSNTELSDDSNYENKDEVIKTLKKTVNLKFVKIKGLKLEINDFETDLNDIVVGVGYVLNRNNDNTDLSVVDKNSSEFKSVLNNMIDGVESYHKVFGTNKGTDDYRIAAYDGGDYKLWESYSVSELYYDNVHKIYLPLQRIRDKFSDNLSLIAVNNNKQFEARSELLSKGNQKDYQWKIDTDPSNVAWNRFSINVQQSDLQKGFVMDGYYKNNVSQFDFDFKLDFINIRFRTDNIWFNWGEQSQSFWRYKSVIEMV
ncbi:hypothetical protein [Spiroplasma tabanidicola]|uniref:Lipoprotein n=1 Tax=Spiroplasma tabanidicola TaxID=324079 RepID=A0A6I6C9T8_9MOLU|nr:hypothetical protein [Spiroplasma tabanidicola]QGS52219.1 hypothetical protein STABA_v1c08640 [Spiroplasma tabanidicola]